MRSTADTTDLFDLQEIQETTGGKQLAPDDLLALRTFFLLLDEWDRNSRPAAPVDAQTESEQGERHARSVSARKQRAA
jgi:hypothetical protein